VSHRGAGKKKQKGDKKKYDAVDVQDKKKKEETYASSSGPKNAEEATI